MSIQNGQGQRSRRPALHVQFACVPLPGTRKIMQGGATAENPALVARLLELSRRRYVSPGSLAKPRLRSK